MPDFESIEDISWYDYKDSITGVVIADGVQSIGNSAFFWLSLEYSAQNH